MTKELILELLKDDEIKTAIQDAMNNGGINGIKKIIKSAETETGNTQAKRINEKLTRAIETSDEYLEIGNVKIKVTEKMLIVQQQIENFHVIKFGEFNNPSVIIQLSYGTDFNF